MTWHIGRAWTGHVIEDECPCEQAPCGLVVTSSTVSCDQHNPEDPIMARTIRQAHLATACPAMQG